MSQSKCKLRFLFFDQQQYRYDGIYHSLNKLQELHVCDVEEQTQSLICFCVLQYGYRLPELAEDEVVYCSVYFRLLGEILFRYPQTLRAALNHI